MSAKEIKVHWAKLDFAMFYVEVLLHDKSDAALAQWVRDFAHQLAFRNDEPVTEPFAVKMLEYSLNLSEQNRNAKNKGIANAKERERATTCVNESEPIEKSRVEQSRAEETKEEKKKTRATNNGTIPFEAFLYSYPIANGQKPAEAIWKKMTDEERQAAIDAVPIYKRTVSDNKFLKHCQNYLKDKVWLEHSQQQKPSQPKPMVIIQDRAAPPMTFDNMGFNNA